jgi:hypothetical protein
MVGLMGADPLTAVLRPLGKFLNENELFYVFSGELALRMLGGTDKVGSLELIVNLTENERDRLLNYMEQEGFEWESRWKGPMAFRHKATGLPVLVRLAGSKAELGALGRRVPATLEYTKFFHMSVEDYILAGLRSKEAEESVLVSVYRKWRNFLDMEYLVVTSRELGVYERFIKTKMKAER